MSNQIILAVTFINGKTIYVLEELEAPHRYMAQANRSSERTVVPQREDVLSPNFIAYRIEDIVESHHVRDIFEIGTLVRTILERQQKVQNINLINSCNALKFYRSRQEKLDDYIRNDFIWKD